MLRNVEDTDAIKSYLGTHKVKRATVVGGGFIGLEMAENLHARGIAVNVIEMAPQVMALVDFSMATIVRLPRWRKRRSPARLARPATSCSRASSRSLLRL